MTRLTADLFPRRGRHPNRKTSEYSALSAEPPLAGRLSRLRWVTRRMITSVQKLRYLDSLGLAG